MNKEEKSLIQKIKIPEILGEPQTREEVMKEIQKNSDAYLKFQQLSKEFREELIEFCMGNRGLKIAYDPFFQKIFNPEVHSERLSRLLSCIMGETVCVKRALPREHNRLSEAGSLLIMDILVELSDGSLINVEMQKIGYAFPGQRGACYSADLLLRQYERVKEQKGKEFTYQDLKSVYCIVLLERSTEEFHKYPEIYLHRSSQTFDSGLDMEHLQKFIYIPLDIFLGIQHNKLEELEAWLYFLSTDKPEYIFRIVEKYPMFYQMYQEIIQFRYKPEELIGMYSEALAILDRNTVQYMYEEQKKEIEKQKLELKENEQKLKESDQKLKEKAQELEEKDQEIARLKALLAEKNN